MKKAQSLYRGHRFPEDIISDCVWLYFRFCLSYRDVQEMMAERGVEVSHEAIRLWCEKFGRQYARRLRKECGRLGDRGHLDEVFVRIAGQQRYLWRAVDQEGNVLDSWSRRRAKRPPQTGSSRSFYTQPDMHHAW